MCLELENRDWATFVIWEIGIVYVPDDKFTFFFGKKKKYTLISLFRDKNATIYASTCEDQNWML